MSAWGLENDVTIELGEAEVEVAILTSKRETRTVELDHSTSAAEQLLAECEGDDGEGLYWGRDCDGNKWSVRLV